MKSTESTFDFLKNRYSTIRTLVSAFCLTALLLVAVDLKAEERSRPRRFIYNSDANHMYYYKKPPMTVSDLESYVDEVADKGVTTFFASPNWGMLPAYPSEVTEMIGSQLSPEKMAQFRKTGKEKERSSERAFSNIYAIHDSGHDPFGVMIRRAKEKKLEVFISFRLNEIHDVQNAESLIVSSFWREHPQWRVGKHGDKLNPIFVEIIGGSKKRRVHPIVASWFPGALNFAVPEVRQLRLAELKECCQRYPIDGLDLDFQRFPIFFPQDEGPKHTETMTAWIREVRAMTQQVGRKRGRPLLLSARVMAKPEQNIAIGLDPVSWAKEGLIDFIEVSHYLRNDFPLPIAAYRRVMPASLPIYASIEVEPNAEKYRNIARQLYNDGVDGLMIFNYFTSRERGIEPDFELLKELADPNKIRAAAD